MARSAIIVGSGAGGSAAAWELTKAGWDVLVLEKGRHLLPGLGTPSGPKTLFGNDEVKAGRFRSARRLDIASIMAQSNSWLDSQRSPRRKLAREQRDQDQNRGRGCQRERIGRRDADQL